MITKHQFFCMVTLFCIGSSTLFALGIQSKQDAWISVLITSAIGVGLVWVYIALQKRHPKQCLGEIVQTVCGPVVGIPLALFYTLYFLYSASTNVRDFCELTSLTQLQSIPLPVIMIIILLPLVYLLFCNVPTLGKLSELLFPCLLVLLGLVLLLVVASGILHPAFLLPVMPNGVKSLLTGSLVRIMESPYGETVAFLTLWKYAEQTDGYVKSSTLAVLFAGALETVLILLIICTLGAEYASISVVPLFKVILLINIKDFITNLSAIGVALIFIGGFFKIAVFYFASVLTLQSVLKIHRNALILLNGALIALGTLSVKGFIQHIWAGTFIRIPYIHGLFAIAIPTLLLLVSLARPADKTAPAKTPG